MKKEKANDLAMFGVEFFCDASFLVHFGWAAATKREKMRGGGGFGEEDEPGTDTDDDFLALSILFLCLLSPLAFLSLTV